MRDRPRVGEILLEAGIIDELQLQSALGEQSRWGRRLGMTLVKLGMVQEGQLVRALARQFDMPVASLAGKKIAPEVIALVPARVAIERTVIPLFTKKDGPKAQLFLGMEDPSDLGILDDLAFRTGMAIRPVMVAPTELGEAIDRYYNARPAPTPPHLPDPLRAADTLSETNLRRLRDETAPTLSELLKPGPAAPESARLAAAPTPATETASPAAAPTPAASVARRLPLTEPIDATPLLPATPDTEPDCAAIPELAFEPEAETQPGAVSPTPLPPACEPLAAPLPLPAPAPRAEAAAPPAPAVAQATEPSVATPGAATPVDFLAVDVARAIEESERTRLVAKAIAHLLIEKGLLGYEELQARIEKLKPTRTSTTD